MRKNEVIALSVWLCFMLLIYAAVAVFTGCEPEPYYVTEEIYTHDTLYVYEETLYTNGFELAAGTQWVLGEEYELWTFIKARNISGETISGARGHSRLYYDPLYELIAYEDYSYFSSEPVWDIQEDTVLSIPDDGIVYCTIKYKGIPVQSYYWTVWIE